MKLRINKGGFLGILITVLSYGASAQNLATTIKVQAMDMANALIKNDFATFSKYMHPNIVDFAGGKDRMKAKMDSADEQMKNFGVGFKKILIGEPGPIIKYKNELQAVLPQTTTMKTPMGELTVETSLVVVSPDKGKSWYFIDTNVYKADRLKSILPTLSPELVIPPQKKPVLIPNKAE